MPLKNKDGQVVEGPFTWVYADGKEIPFDPEGNLSKLSAVNHESLGRRKEIKTLKEQLQVLDGIEDPAEFIAKANEAFVTIEDLDLKKLIDSGELEKVKAEIIAASETKLNATMKAMQTKLDDATGQLGTTRSDLFKEMIGGRFARSKFIAEEMVIPSDLVESRFGAGFKIEDGEIVGYDSTGSKIFSREHPGELALFEEALKRMVDEYPHKDNILKAIGVKGAGSDTNSSRAALGDGVIAPGDDAGFLDNLDAIAGGKVRVGA